MDQDAIARRRWVFFSVVALAAALVILLGSFFLIRSQAENAAGPSASRVTARIVGEMNNSDLAEVSTSQLSKHYSIPDGVIADSSLYMSKSSDSASELACFLLTDKSKFPQLQAAITAHLTAKAAGFKSLNPAQYNELKNASVVQAEKYVLVSVGSNTAANEKQFRDLLKNQ